MGPFARARRDANRTLQVAAMRAEYETSSLRMMAARRGITISGMRAQMIVRRIARRKRGGDFRKWVGLAVLLMLMGCQMTTSPTLKAEAWHRHPTPTARCANDPGLIDPPVRDSETDC